MPVNGKPNGRFELPALSPINFNLTDGTDIPPPPESPIEAKAPKQSEIKTTSAPKPSTPNPPQISHPTPPASATSQSENTLHPVQTNGNGLNSNSRPFSKESDKPSPLRARTPSDVNHKLPNSPTRPNGIRKFLSRKSLNGNLTNGQNANGNGASSHEDLTKMARPDSPSSFLSTKPSIIKRKSGSWFSNFGRSSKRSSVVYENKTSLSRVPTLGESLEVKEDPVDENRTEKPPVIAGPPPPKLPELNQLKAKIADDDQGSLGGAEMFKNIS